ncbi:MAG: LapA family protein [Minisyncoccia bacterium]
MLRTIIYLVLFILTIIFLFQNGGEPVTLKFLKWETPTTIPVGFVFVGALLIGIVVVWLYHLPQIIILKGKLKNLDRRVTFLMEDLKRKENELSNLKKLEDELENKLKEKKEEPKKEKKKENIQGSETKEEKKEEEKKRGFFSFLKRRKEDENKEVS